MKYSKQIQQFIWPNNNLLIGCHWKRLRDRACSGPLETQSEAMQTVPAFIYLWLGIIQAWCGLLVAMRGGNQLLATCH